MREKLSHQYIRGRGIEIGGLHCPLPVLPGVKVTYVDRLPPGEAHPDVQTKVKDVVIDDAEILKHFKHDSLDFIIANHVIEHCRDPLGTLCIWWDRLVDGGIAFIAVPEKTKTFDAPRAVTTLQHLLDDEAAGFSGTNDTDHYREWLSIIDKIQEPELSKRVQDCVDTKANIHFHVWDEPAMREIMEWLKKETNYEVVEFVPNGAEVIWILRRLG